MSALNMKFHGPEKPFQGSQIFRVTLFLKETFATATKSQEKRIILSCPQNYVLHRLEAEKDSLAPFCSCAVGGDMRKSNAVSDNSTHMVC